MADNIENKKDYIENDGVSLIDDGSGEEQKLRNFFKEVLNIEAIEYMSEEELNALEEEQFNNLIQLFNEENEKDINDIKWKLNKGRFEDFLQSYKEIYNCISLHNDIKIKCETMQYALYQWTICIEGSSLHFINSNLFATALGRASQISIYRKLGNKVHFEICFNDIFISEEG